MPTLRPCHARGNRYSREAGEAVLANKDGAAVSLPDLMAMDISDALSFVSSMTGTGKGNKGSIVGGASVRGASGVGLASGVKPKLQTLCDLGLGYLTLGEATPALSGGEAQRLKLQVEMGRTQSNTVFVFDEPTIGLHPLDVRQLLGVFTSLVGRGATVIVIEHDIDVMRAADWMIDMGPGGGDDGGTIVAQGTPKQIAQNPASVTGKYLVND